MAREIRIMIDDHGSLDVWEGDCHTDQLCFGEMLETIVDLCHPKLPGVARYSMLTAEEWRARHPKVTSDEFAEVQPAPPSKQCTKSGWCDQTNGHDGPCNEDNLPF